jgi:predicted membrane channel-forming protein YqfA (hemolysin III family)
MGLTGLDDSEKQLLYVSGLPLVDGVFATLLVAGSVAGIADMMSIALTVFAGAGSLAVLYSNSSSRREALKMVGNVSPYLLAGGLLVSLIAPVFRQMFSMTSLQYVAGGVLAVIAIKLYGLDLAERLNPSWILVPGLILSLNSFNPVFSLEYVFAGTGTVLLALASLTVFALLRNLDLHLGTIRTGSAVVLLIFSVSLFGAPVSTDLGVGVFGLAFGASLLRGRRSIEFWNWRRNLFHQLNFLYALDSALVSYDN